MPDPAGLHPVILPASGPTIVGIDAPALHPQQLPRWVKDFSRAVLSFLREKVPTNWHVYCDQVTDNFRVIDPQIFGFSRELGLGQRLQRVKMLFSQLQPLRRKSGLRQSRKIGC
jgi:hypothetical protein